MTAIIYRAPGTNPGGWISGAFCVNRLQRAGSSVVFVYRGAQQTWSYLFVFVTLVGVAERSRDIYRPSFWMFATRPSRGKEEKRQRRQLEESRSLGFQL